ncbi:lipoprotein-releasing system permease protein [Nonlabens dokdonensis]|uniref:Lipoprotein-releasing system permease protein n=2 Tax=Nonlabens dokdonensis TaxID=328515 RepID=A0ABX5Q2I9_9FLAO|nr:FtsX-like permease family protein [Nonlabens dokdonensis]AGC76608.1 putative lipoprotein releasing system transmembrane protein [Nonlabens dokdonensis DSW-6]PZX44257.1 lipoprotein-releasing system permease protein [Nonlabens dokdonensis]
MNFSFYIARRYLVSKNGKNAINIINILSFIITVVGTAALFIVLSGFSGLKDFSTEFSNYFDPDLKVLPVNGKTVEIPLSRKRELENISGIALVCAVIEEKAFLNYEEKNDIAFIKGVPEGYVNMISTDSILYYGSWLSKSDAQVVAGYSLAARLSLTVNDYGNYMQIMVPKPGANAINKLNLNSSFSRLDAIPVGTFSVNEALDSKYIFTRLSAARKLLNLSDSTASAVEVKLKDGASQKEVRAAIHEVFDEPVKIKDKFQMNDALYKMLNSENLVVYLIFTLVLIIALFNVVGSIIMMILDKKKNMKTLLDLGAPVESLRKIFFIQGSLMTLSGGVIGLVIGVVFVALQVQYDLIYIAPGIPYPFAMELVNVFISLATIAVLGVIASYIGSRRINDRLLSQAKL